MPWICRGDTFCKPIKIDGVADKDLAQAAIEPLGYAGPRYFLSYKQANFEKGKEVRAVLHRGTLRQARFDRRRRSRARHLPGQAGRPRADPHRHPAPPRGQGRPRPAAVVHRERLLGAAGDARRRAVPLLHGQRPQRRSHRGVAARQVGRRAVVRPGRGRRQRPARLREEPRSCWRISRPRRRPPPRRRPRRRRAGPGDGRRARRPCRLDRSRHPAGDFATADRLLADATRRYAGYSAWPPLQQKLAKARADRAQSARPRPAG